MKMKLLISDNNKQYLQIQELEKQIDVFQRQERSLWVPSTQRKHDGLQSAQNKEAENAKSVLWHRYLVIPKATEKVTVCSPTRSK